MQANENSVGIPLVHPLTPTVTFTNLLPVFKMKASGPLPTAVICASDDTALGFIQAARDAGLRCPEDVSVIGFDNESADGPSPLADLTTLDFSREALAHELVRLIEAQATGATRRPEKVRLPMILLKRRSCAAPRA